MGNHARWLMAGLFLFLASTTLAASPEDTLAQIERLKQTEQQCLAKLKPKREQLQVVTAELSNHSDGTKALIEKRDRIGEPYYAIRTRIKGLQDQKDFLDARISRREEGADSTTSKELGEAIAGLEKEAKIVAGKIDEGLTGGETLAKMENAVLLSQTTDADLTARQKLLRGEIAELETDHTLAVKKRERLTKSLPPPGPVAPMVAPPVAPPAAPEVVSYLFPCQLPGRHRGLDIPLPYEVSHYLEQGDGMVMLELQLAHHHAAAYRAALDGRNKAADGAAILEAMITLAGTHRDLMRQSGQLAYHNTAIRYPAKGFLIRTQLDGSTTWRFGAWHEDREKIIGLWSLYPLRRGEQELDVAAASADMVVRTQFAVYARHDRPPRTQDFSVPWPDGSVRKVPRTLPADITYMRAEVKAMAAAHLARQAKLRGAADQHQWLLEGVDNTAICFDKLWKTPECSIIDLMASLEQREQFLERCLDSPGWKDTEIGSWTSCGSFFSDCKRAGPVTLPLVRPLLEKIASHQGTQCQLATACAYNTMGNLLFSKGEFAAALRCLDQEMELWKAARPNLDVQKDFAWVPQRSFLEQLKAAIEKKP